VRDSRNFVIITLALIKFTIFHALSVAAEIHRKNTSTNTDLSLYRKSSHLINLSILLRLEDRKFTSSVNLLVTLRVTNIIYPYMYALYKVQSTRDCSQSSQGESPDGPGFRYITMEHD